MGVPLRVLFIEDVEDDYLLVLRELQRGGFEVDSQLVELPEEIEAALRSGPWDIVLSDYSLPRLDAMAALEIVQRHDPEIPVIILSGTIGEDTAVAALQQGARDFMLKTNLARLVPAVTRALETVRGRREQRAMEVALLASEERLRHAQKLDSIGRLAGGIAHDFNNVLSVIRGSAEFLIADIPAHAARVEDATEIRDAAERASRLVSQLLAFSGRRLIEPRPLDVNELVAGMKSLLRRLIPESVTIL
ncbi:MAG: sensor histidine kinase, partial [Longimicrobiales bacterium]